MMNAFIICTLYLHLLVTQSTSTLEQKLSTVGGHECNMSVQTLREAFEDLSTNTILMKERYPLSISGKMVKTFPPPDNDPLIEYQIELASADTPTITEFTIIADVGSCWQQTGWFDKLDPTWSITQCVKSQYKILTVLRNTLPKIKLTWNTLLSCNTTLRYNVSSSELLTGKEGYHRRSTRSMSDSNLAPTLLVANLYFLHQLSLDGTRENTIASSRGGIFAIDFHYRMGRLFWSDIYRDLIVMSNLDGSQPTVILEQQLRNPTGLAVDWINNKLYLVDAVSYQNYVGVLDLQSYIFKQLITLPRESNLYDIIVDPTTRWLYWNDYYHNTIEKASMDGKNRTIIIDTNVPVTHSLTLDYQMQMLYWVDSDYRKLESATVNGTNRKTVYMFPTTYNIIGLSLFEDTLFISQAGNSIYKMTTTGQNLTQIDIHTSHCYKAYRRLNVFSKERQPLTSSPNPCAGNNGGCSHFCLLSAVDPRGYTCDCPTGMTLTTDMKNCTGTTTFPITQSGSCVAAGYTNTCCSGLAGSCQGSPSFCYCDANCRLFDDCCSDVPDDCDEQELKEYIMITNQNFIHRLDISSSFRLQTTLSNLKSAAKLDYHYRNNSLFWTGVYNNSLFIWRSSLDNGSDAFPLVDTGARSTQQYVDIAVDWITDKIYWTNINLIMVYDLHTGYRAAVINSTDAGVIYHQVLVDPSTSTLYWSDVGSTPKIGRSSMDGSVSSTVLNNSRAYYKLTFTLDIAEQVLYWINGTRSCYLESSNVDGSNKSVVYNATHRYGCSSYYYTYSPYSYSMDVFGKTVFTSGYNQYVSRTTTEGRPRILSTLFYTQCRSRVVHGMKVISRQRQLQSFNPCANNNGGCAHLCLLSSTHADGYTCACHNKSQLQSNLRDCIPRIPKTQLQVSNKSVQGSCLRAGYSTCCESGACVGRDPENCYCDRLCYIFEDCCQDISVTCNRSVFNTTTLVLSRPTPLSFIAQPLNQSVFQFERAELFCFVRSTLNPTFAWNFVRKGKTRSIVDRHNPLSPDYFIKLGERSQLLIIKETKWVHEGVYRCIASTGNKTIQAEAMLQVLVPASDIDINGSIGTIEGKDVFNINCSVIANPTANIVWFSITDTQTLTNTSQTSITYQFTTDSAPISLSTLQISTDESSDYTCEADNNLSTAVSLNFSIIITDRCKCIKSYKGNKCQVEGQDINTLVFITKPEEQTVTERNLVEFQCSTCSALEPTITWNVTRKGSLQSEAINENSTFGDYTIIYGENSLTLIINSANWTHEGVYECTAFTDNTIIQSKADLTVWIPARDIVIKGNTDTPDEQETVILECSVIANPPATLVWMMGSGNESMEVNSTLRTNITHNFNSTNEPFSSSTLIISNITDADSGVYYCIAENRLSLSPVSDNFTVTVTALPPAPVDVEAICSHILWHNAPNISLQNISGYDVRLLNPVENYDVIRHIDSSATFYNLHAVDDKMFKIESTLVQVRVVTTKHLGLFSPQTSLGCDHSASIVEYTGPGVYLQMGGKNYTNNSVIDMADIGVGKNALFCMTDKECCCGYHPYRYGQFYYPTGTIVPINEAGQALYRDRRVQKIRLNRRPGMRYLPGVYHCEIPNSVGEMQKLYFTLRTSN